MWYLVLFAMCIYNICLIIIMNIIIIRINDNCSGVVVVSPLNITIRNDINKTNFAIYMHVFLCT